MGSAYSNVVQVDIDATENAIKLTCVPVTSGTVEAPVYMDTLSWTANFPGAATQRIYRQINNGGYSLLKSGLAASVGSFIDQAPAGAWLQGQYDYYVQALSGAGSVLATSNVASVTWPRGDEDPLELAVEQSTTMSGSSVFNVNTLLWNDINAYTYVAYRQISTLEGPFDSIASVGDATLTYVDEGLADSPSFPAGTYSYYVVGLDYNGVPIARSPTISVTWS